MPTQLVINDQALLPAIAQDADTGAVLMFAYMNHEALSRTIESGQAWFYSRSRQELWHKGATSGNFLNVVEIRPDCDGDVILLKVNPEGPACHTGSETCFFPDFDTSSWEMEPSSSDQLGPTLAELAMTVAQRRRDKPDGSYTASLFERGTERIAQKVMEEGGETALAAMAKAPERVRSEAADLLFHLTVLLEEAGVTLNEVAAELADRRR